LGLAQEIDEKPRFEVSRILEFSKHPLGIPRFQDAESGARFLYTKVMYFFFHLLIGEPLQDNLKADLNPLYNKQKKVLYEWAC
jgi:hypothetical protein